MKIKIVLAALVMGLSFLSQAQMKNYTTYKERAERNLKFLSNDLSIQQRVHIDNKGIIIYSDETHKKIDLTVYWTDLPKFIDILENSDYYQMVDVISHKGAQAFFNGYNQTTGLNGVPQIYQVYTPMPDTTNGLRVAIDPGHFGGNMDEAWLEKRIAKFQGKDVGSPTDVQFFEADLTYAVSLILKQLLREAGVNNVLISRPYAVSAIGKPFKAWMKEDFRSDLEEAKKLGDVTPEMYKLLRDSAASELFVFENFYKFLEFRARMYQIREFAPDVTFVIHFNAMEGNRRFGDRYLSPVQDNFNMAFVPGAFLQDELKKTDQKVDFIRLLLSKDLDNSMRLAGHLMTAHERVLKVPTIPAENSIRVLREASIPTPYPGVYCRNLYLTRSTRSAVVYGESLYQDNVDEIKKLGAKDYEVALENGKKIKVPYRCKQVAEAYRDALLAYLKENKVLKVKEQEELNAEVIKYSAPETTGKKN